MKYLVIALLLICTTTYAQLDKEYYVNNSKPYIAQPITGQQPTGTEIDYFISLDQLQNAIDGLAINTLYNITIYIKANPEEDYKSLNYGMPIINFNKSELQINNLVIRNYLSDNSNPVIDATNNTFGFEIRLNDASATINNVYVQNLTIKNSSDDALKIRGQPGKLISNATVENCSLLQSRKRGLNANNVQTLIVKNNQIKSEGTSLENDGMYLENCITSTISNNYIETYNSYSTEISSPHVDCIQTVGCKDVSIFNNKLISNSNLSYYAHRSGIIMSGNTGNVNIYNNIIKSFSNNLINADLLQSTSIIKIFNNTFLGYKQNHLVDVLTNSSNINNIQITNNIFYKDNLNSEAKTVIKFRGISSITLNSLVNNCYYTSNGIPNVICELNKESDSYDLTKYENPLVDYNTLKISKLSSVKNSGIYLSSITKDINNNNRPHWQKESFDIGAEEIPDAQIKIGVTGLTEVDNPYINHSITAFGATWSSNQLNIDNSTILKSATYQTIGNTDPSLKKKYWDGFTYNWLKQGTNDPNSSCGIGVYKISNNHNPNVYFYLDMRHWRNETNFNPNVNILYDADLNKYAVYINNVREYIDENASIVRIWDILNEQPNTEPLNNYWANALTIIPNIASLNIPRLLWGPNTTNGNVSSYNVYRKIEWGGRPSVFGKLTPSLNNTTWEFYDQDLLLGGGHRLSYKVSSIIGTTEYFTNVYDTSTSGLFKEKATFKNNMEYSLSQNYPNPFNPSTVITFTNKSKEYVELRVFDVLSREIRTLLNQEMEPGEHKVTFDAGNLPSGIYFYNIKVGDFTQTNKMILMK